MKKVCVMLITVCLLTGIVFAGGKNEQQTTTAEVIELQFSINFAADHQITKGYEKMAEAIKEKSGGRLIITVFPGAQLGKTNDVLSMINADAMDMTCTGTGAMATYYSPLGIFDAPYVFEDAAHMLKFANSETGQEIWNGLAKASNLRNIGTVYYGTRQITMAKVAATNPKEMNGLKLRVPDEPMGLAYGKALGASPTPMAFGEVYLALQQGVVDGQENPLPSIISGKFYEVCKYLVLSGHVIGNQATIINEKTYQALPTDLKSILDEEAAKYVKEMSDETSANEEEQLAFLKSEGMEVVIPDINAFKSSCKSIIDDYESSWGEGLYEKVQALK